MDGMPWDGAFWPRFSRIDNPLLRIILPHPFLLLLPLESIRNIFP